MKINFLSKPLSDPGTVIRNLFRHSILLFVLSSALSGCSPSLDEAALKKFITNERSGVFKTSNINGYTFNVYIRPSDLMALPELRSHTALQKQTRDSILTGYQNFLYVMVEISKDDKGILQSTTTHVEYNSLIQELAFAVNEKIRISTNDKEEVYPVNHQLGQFYGMELSTTILFVFPKDEIIKSRSFRLIIDEFGLNTGTVEFSFKTRNINKIPALCI